MLSSNSLIISHGPSPTPTKTIDSGYSLQFNENIRMQNGIQRRENKAKVTWLLQLHQLSSVPVDLTDHALCQRFWSPVATF